MKDFLNLSADNFLNIGISRPDAEIHDGLDNLKNVVNGLPITGNLWHPGPDADPMVLRQAAK